MRNLSVSGALQCTKRLFRQRMKTPSNRKAKKKMMHMEKACLGVSGRERVGGNVEGPFAFSWFLASGA